MGGWPPFLKTQLLSLASDRSRFDCTAGFSFRKRIILQGDVPESASFSSGRWTAYLGTTPGLAGNFRGSRMVAEPAGFL